MERKGRTKWTAEAAAAFTASKLQVLGIQALQLQMDQQRQLKQQMQQQQLQWQQQHKRQRNPQILQLLTREAVSDDAVCGVEPLGSGEIGLANPLGTSVMEKLLEENCRAAMSNQPESNAPTAQSDENAQPVLDSSSPICSRATPLVETPVESDDSPGRTAPTGPSDDGSESPVPTDYLPGASEMLDRLEGGHQKEWDGLPRNHVQKVVAENDGTDSSEMLEPRTLKRKRDCNSCELDIGNVSDKPPSIATEGTQRPTRLPARGDGAQPTTSQITISHIMQHHKDDLTVSARLKLAKHLIHNTLEAEMYNVLDDKSRAEYVREFASSVPTV